MKVTPPPIAPPRQRPTPNDSADANKTTTKRAADNGNATSAVDANADATGIGRDFAGVLKDVSRTSGHDKGESGEGGEGADKKREGRATDGAERERQTTRREDTSEGSGERGGGGHLSGRGAAPVHETGTTLGETTSARAVLHIADLERILAAVRTQTTLGGRREVTLELQRSVLEGLRVKLSTDERGRVTAEFIASTERVRAQVESRTSDLADLLRSRGVELTSLKTSLGAGASDQHGAGEGRHQSQASEHIAPTRDSAHRSASNASEADAGVNSQAQDLSDSTYRA